LIAVLLPSLSRLFPPAARPRVLRTAGVLLLLLAVARSTVAAVPEQTAKAAVVFHLLQFVTWPDAAAAGPFQIGVLGTGSFEEALRAMVAGETMAGRPIVVKRAAGAATLADCDLVYVEDGGREPLRRVLTGLGRRAILTVGESEDFAAAGGMIALRRTAERKLRLQVNLAAAEAAGFKISAQLLRVADVVKGDPR
jgi:hypothetical protein